MTYADFKARRRELHLKYGEVKVADGNLVAVEAEIDALVEAHDRFYRLDADYGLQIRLGSMLPWPYISLVRMAGPHVHEHSVYDIGRMVPATIRRMAVVKETVDQYISGVLAELPPKQP